MSLSAELAYVRKLNDENQVSPTEKDYQIEEYKNFKIVYLPICNQWRVKTFTWTKYFNTLRGAKMAISKMGF